LKDRLWMTVRGKRPTRLLTFKAQRLHLFQAAFKCSLRGPIASSIVRTRPASVTYTVATDHGDGSIGASLSKRKMKSRCLHGQVTTLFCLTTLAVAAQATIVFNGGFETGDLTGWTLTNASVYDAVCQAGHPIGAATCIVHSGNYAMSLGHAGGVTTLSQSLATTPGVLYNLEFYLANDNPSDVGTETFEVMWDGSSVYSLSSPQPSFPYTLVSLDVTATSNSTTLAFLAEQDPSQWFLDDVSVQAIPEATTMFMVVVGLVTAGLARRSRRRPIQGS